MLQLMRTLVLCALPTLLALPLIAAAEAIPPIHPFNPDSLSQIVQARHGKPFVLIVWSLDCEYCQASLQTLAQEKQRRRNLDIVTVATDPLDDAQTAALLGKKLGGFGLTADAWAFGAMPPEQLRYVIDARWHGEMPRSYWFDAQGHSVPYSGVLTPATMEKLMTGAHSGKS